MNNTITLTFDAPRRQTFKLPLFTRDKTNTFFYCVLSDDCVIVVDSGRIEISDVPKQALRQGYVEIDEYAFRERYEKAQQCISNCLAAIDDFKKDPETIDSNHQLRHQ
jgi:hypothetical protein